MTINEYQKAAMRTVSGVAEATKENQLLMGVMGLNGEAGEVIDIVKKIMFHGHPYDQQSKEHIVKELGDVAWYLAVSAEALGCPLEEVFQKNVDKLRERYPNGFEVEKSLHRKPGDE